MGLLPVMVGCGLLMLGFAWGGGCSNTAETLPSENEGGGTVERRDPGIEEGVATKLKVGQVVPLQNQANPPQKFKITWLGPGPHDAPPNHISRGLWETEALSAQVQWQVLDGYAFGFGWGPLIYINHEIAGTDGLTISRTQGASNCQDGELRVAVQKVDKNKRRVILLDRETNGCPGAQNYLIMVTATGATNSVSLDDLVDGEVKQEYAEVVIDADGNVSLTGPHLVESSEKVQEFVKFLTHRRKAHDLP